VQGLRSFGNAGVAAQRVGALRAMLKTFDGNSPQSAVPRCRMSTGSGRPNDRPCTLAKLVDACVRPSQAEERVSPSINCCC